MIERLTKQGLCDFGEAIRTQREAKGLSIRDLSNLTGFSSAAISRWESGKRTPTVEAFNKIMTALNAELIIIEH